MTRTNDATLFEWLDRAAEGTLAETDREALDRELDSRPELAGEAVAFGRLHRLLTSDRIAVHQGFAHRVVEDIKALLRLDHLLATDRIAVRQGFAERVLAALPMDPARARGAWRLPAALAVTLAVAGSFLLLSSGAFTGSALGSLAAVADFFQTATLAAAGLLGATWQGVTLAFDELLLGSRTSLIALLVGVAFLDLLFLRILLRPRHAPATSDADETP